LILFPGSLETTAGGERLRLLPQRALLLPDHGVLLVADAHIGKAVSFRRLGVPVPAGTTEATLQRLSEALALTQARHLIFLGDLLHSARGRAADTVAAVARWRERRPDLQLTLVRGNHDHHAGDPPTDWGMRCVDEPLALGGLALCHEPGPRPGAYVLAGHVHPCAVIGGRAHQRLRLPCFHLGPQVGVLPAFGEFTGSHTLPRGPQDRVFVTTGETVREVPTLHFSA
jgi:DNA ligase-associated metallophosphoesterase